MNLILKIFWSLCLEEFVSKIIILLNVNPVLIWQDENRYSAGRGAHKTLKRAEKARILVSKIPCESYLSINY